MSENEANAKATNVEAPKGALRRVELLIQQAEEFRRHGEEGSAEAAYHLADEIMTKYAIDRAFLESVKPRDAREKPVKVVLPFPSYYDEWFDEYRWMLRNVCETAQVQLHFQRKREVVNANLVGFSADIEYVQMLWVSIHLTFSSKLNPSWDSRLTEDENVKILKEAGWKWERIAQAGGFDWPDGGKLKRAYRRQCAKEGVTPTAHTQRHEAYRKSFANAFSSAVNTRLYTMQAKRKETAKSSGAELVLRDRTADVEAEFYNLFPNLRPPSKEEMDKWRAEQDALRAKEKEEWDKLSPEEQERRTRAEEKRQAANERRWAREDAKRFDSAGASAGRRAGESVDLSAGRNHVRNSDNKQIGG